MWRFLAGVASALLLVTAGLFIWRSHAGAEELIPAAASGGAGQPGFSGAGGPLEASEKTREEKRFSRYDKDKNGGVSRDEYLVARRKAFAKFDVNADGRLSFDEYATKTIQKFFAADKDKTGVLTPAEFLTTRLVRKTGGTKCPPPTRLPAAPAAGAGGADEDEG